MTVATTSITSGPYLGTGASDQFSYTFRIDEEDELKVYEITDLGAVSLLTLNVDYSVDSVGDPSGGLITRLAGNLPSGYYWYIRSNYQSDQNTVFSSQGGFFPDVHEYAIDKLTFLTQQLEDAISRSIRLAESDQSGETAVMTLPDQSSRANKAVIFDASGNATVSADDYVDQAANAAASAAAALASENASAASAVLAAAAEAAAVVAQGLAEDARDAAIEASPVQTGTFTGGSATTGTHSDSTRGVDSQVGMLIVIKRAGVTLRQDAITACDSAGYTFASGTAVANGDTFTVYSGGKASLSSAMQTLGDQGFVGNVSNTDIELFKGDLVDVRPIYSDTFSITSAAADKANFVGQIRTIGITMTNTGGNHTGATAGMYLVHSNGYDYPIVSVSGATANVLSIEYPAQYPDPTGTGPAWIGLGYIGGIEISQLISRASPKLYFDPDTRLLTGMPAGFPCFERNPWSGHVELKVDSYAVANDTNTGHRGQASWGGFLGGTGTKVDDAIGIDGSANTATTFTDTDATGAAYTRKFSTIAVPSTTRHYTTVFVQKTTSAPTVFPRFFISLNGGTARNGEAISFDPFTGAIVKAGIAAVVADWNDPIDRGDFWQLDGYIDEAVADANTTLTLVVHPAYSATLGGAQDNTLTGSVVLDWAQQSQSIYLAGPCTPATLTTATELVTIPAKYAGKPDDAVTLATDITWSNSLVAAGTANKVFMNVAGETSRYVYADATNLRYVHGSANVVIKAGGAAVRTPNRLVLAMAATTGEVYVNGIKAATTVTKGAVTGTATSIQLGGMHGYLSFFRSWLGKTLTAAESEAA